MIKSKTIREIFQKHKVTVQKTGYVLNQKDLDRAISDIRELLEREMPPKKGGGKNEVDIFMDGGFNDCRIVVSAMHDEVCKR